MTGAGKHGSSAHPRESFRRHLLRAAPILLLVTGAVYVLSHLGVMRGFETAALDVWLKVNRSQPVQDLVIVTIDDEDYREIFGARSPLEPSGIQRIVEAVAAGNPRVIGVDLDTSGEHWSAWSPPRSVPTVWAREGISDEAAHDEDEHGSRTVFRVGPVLGRDAFEPEDGIHWGLALTPQDPDGVVRRYVYQLPAIDAGGSRHEVDAFAFAVAKFASEHDRGSGSHAIVLNFAGDRWAFPRIAARDVLAAATGDGWRTASPLRDKIVLIGGTYRAARDEYVTPVGTLSGVHIVAQAVQTHLQGAGIREVSHGLMTLFEIASGVLLVWVNYKFRMRTALLLSLVAMPLLTLLGSAISFSSLAYWFNFVPALLGVWIHELIDHAREYRLLHEEVRHLRAIVAAGAESVPGDGVPEGAGEAPADGRVADDATGSCDD